MAVRDGMDVAGIGLLIAVLGADGIGRVLQSQLAGIQPADAVAFLVAPAVLTAGALTACPLPARRAAAIDPAVVLQYEEPFRAFLQASDVGPLKARTPHSRPRRTSFA